MHEMHETPRVPSLSARGVSCSFSSGLSHMERPMYKVDIRLIHRPLLRLSRKECFINSLSSKMSGYDWDYDSHALDLYEKQKTCKMLLTQNACRLCMYVCLWFFALSTVLQLFNGDSSQIHISWTII